MTSRVDFLVSSWKSVFSNLQRSSMMTLCYEKLWVSVAVFHYYRPNQWVKKETKKLRFALK